MNSIHKNQAPQPSNNYHFDHAKLLIESFRRVCGRDLISAAGKIRNDSSQRDLAKALFEANVVVVSHGTEADPIFNYANQRALTLFEMNWDEFTALPSRKSAEPLHRDAREELMQTVRDNGFIDNYSGVRISSSGQRFSIESAVVWNVIDPLGVLHGQAATFSEVSFLR